MTKPRRRQKGSRPALRRESYRPRQAKLDRCAACGKVCYADRKLAAAAAAKYAAANDIAKADVNYYRCAGTAAWHIGHVRGWRGANGLEPRPLPKWNRSNP